MLVLLTGSTGFIGRALLKQLHSKDDVLVRAALRRNVTDMPSYIETTQVVDLSPDNKWQACLSAVDAVIHTAGRAHVLRDTARDPLTEFRRVNVEGTRNVVNMALHCGVKQLLHISSIAVFTRTGKEQYITEKTGWQATRFTSKYGLTKHLAEMEAWRGYAEGLRVAIINPSIILGGG